MHWFFKITLILVLFFSLWSTVVYAIPKVLPAEVISDGEVHGFILRSQVWQGTIRITGDVIATSGTTITIKPGTKVLISSLHDKFNLDLLPWHQKSGINVTAYSHGVDKGEPYFDEKEKIQVHLGNINAIGTKEQPIIIRSDSALPSPYDINVIAVSSGVISNAQIQNYRRFEVSNETVIRDSQFSEAGECSICISSGSPTLINNQFNDALRESIWIQKASPRITDNQFINLDGEGIKIDAGKAVRPIISHNDFQMPGMTAINILSGGERNPGTISFNIFSGNSVILLACDSKINLSENNLGARIRFNGNGCGGSYTFGPNYWGVKELKTIYSEKIMGKDKNFEVKIPSVLDSPPPLVGPRAKN